jgi:hypothetical protein
MLGFAILAGIAAVGVAGIAGALGGPENKAPIKTIS